MTLPSGYRIPTSASASTVESTALPLRFGVLWVEVVGHQWPHAQACMWQVAISIKCKLHATSSLSLKYKGSLLFLQPCKHVRGICLEVEATLQMSAGTLTPIYLNWVHALQLRSA